MFFVISYYHLPFLQNMRNKEVLQMEQQEFITHLVYFTRVSLENPKHISKKKKAVKGNFSV